MSSLNKPFDRFAKELSDEAPELLVRAIALFPPDARITIRTLRPETSPPARLVDVVVVLDIEGEREFIFHLEFCVSFDAEVLSVLACYGGSLATQYRRMRILSVLVLLDRRRAGVVVPKVAEFINHGTVISHPFRTVRIWEMDPTPILESGDVRFLPWALVMNSTTEQVLSVAAQIRRSRDEEAAARFLVLGSLRYDREELERMLGGAHMGLMEAILEGSSLVKDIADRAAKEAREQAREQGLEEGIEQGIEQGRRELLRDALRDHFPGLELDPAVDAVSSPEAISRILAATFTGRNRQELERLLHEAAARAH